MRGKRTTDLASCKARMADGPPVVASAQSWLPFADGLAGLQRFAEAIGPDGRTRLLRILEASDEDRAAAIGRLHLRDDGALLEELLIELEEKEWARQAVIEELRRQ
jgi:hypothetical protein